MARRSKPKTFGQMIAEHRTREGLSYRQAEEASDVDKASIHRIEMGNVPNIVNFSRLVRWARLDANTLIDEFADAG